MTNKQAIIAKAIERAKKNGWDVPRNLTFISYKEFLVYLDELSSTENIKWLKFKANELLFNHEFAKALWGEELDYCMACERSHGSSIDCDMGCGNCTQSWKFHLMLMVIAEDPIAYLGEHLDG